jgi:hypothetical protein
LKSQTLDYGVKYKNETSKCQTQAFFSNYNFNPHFSSKFFNTELAITEKEAYEKDSSFWAGVRPASLTDEERKFILAKDSIKDFQNRKEYLDSVDKILDKYDDKYFCNLYTLIVDGKIKKYFEGKKLETLYKIL